MNTLESLRHAHETGELAKQNYIASIHTRHATLWDYPQFFADTDVESLSIQPDGIFIRSRSQQIDLLVDPNDEHLVPCTLMNFRAYEAMETEFLKFVSTPGCTILDIGANCGWYSLTLARHCPSASIHAFEPIPHTHDVLVRNVERNGLHNITTHRMGLSDREASLEFLHTPTCSGATSLTIAGQPCAPDGLQRITCPTSTLDAFCMQNALAPQIIKCDVEGAELMVLQGGTELLGKHKPVILVELLRRWSRKFGYHPNDVIALLARLGYHAYTFAASGLMPCPVIDEDTIETNFVFLHEQDHQHLPALYAASLIP